MEIGMKKAALMKLQKYCAYQDRCHQEVRQKLFDLKVYGDDQVELMASLIADGFLNEERYARSFARGKFRINRWGRVKIQQALRQKQVSDYCVNAGLQEIDEEEYRAALLELIKKLVAQYGEISDPVARNKTFQALVRKGYETWLVSKELGEQY